MNLKMSKKDWAVELVFIAILLLIALATIYPFLNVLAISFNEANDTIRGGITVFPRKFTWNNYAKVLSYPNLITGFVNSVIRTVVGTILSVFATSLVAYTLSRKDFMARKGLNVLFMLTMYLSGGMVPGYLLIRDLHLFNNFLVYIIPGLLGAFYIFLTRSYMEGLPYSLQESAMLDGANDLVIFFKVIFPLCAPTLATVALFYAVNHWNDWFTTYLYCSTNEKLTTLQYELQKIIKSATSAAQQAAQSGNTQALIEQAKSGGVTPQSIQMAITIVVVVPIIMVYPFLQKYFVSGMTVGAVKG